jgi:hypothetical protein
MGRHRNDLKIARGLVKPASQFYCLLTLLRIKKERGKAHCTPQRQPSAWDSITILYRPSAMAYTHSTLKRTTFQRGADIKFVPFIQMVTISEHKSKPVEED